MKKLATMRQVERNWMEIEKIGEKEEKMGQVERNWTENEKLVKDR